MKRVTLYWDNDGSFGLFYYNGKNWRYRALSGWRNCINLDWMPDDFNKSLTVNNFKEK